MRIGSLLVGIVLFTLPAWAVEVRELADPRAQDRWIRDQADVFSRKSEEQLEARLARARQGGAELVVATVWDTGSQDPDQAARTLLQHWNLAPNGAIILLVSGKREFYVAPGVQLAKQLTKPTLERLLAVQAAPHLQHRDYGAALVALVDGMTGDAGVTLGPAWAPPFVREPIGPLAMLLAGLGLLPLGLLQGLARRATRAVKRVEMREAHSAFRLRFGMGLAAAWALGLFLLFVHPLVGPLGLVLGLGYSAWYGIWLVRLDQTYRTAPITCACGDQMTPLSEAHEETYLDAAKKRAQDLGQKNYVVYFCSRCEKTQVEEHV